MGDVVRAPHPIVVALAVALSPLVTPACLVLILGMWP